MTADNNMAITSSSSTGLLMLMLLVTLPYSRGACPRPCACYAPAEVHCTFRSLVAVPAGISTGVQRINLGFNTINHITNVSFHGLRHLELLMMHGNNVQNIPDGAFQDLASLQILKMSYNKLRIITGHTFSSLTSLVRLHLDHNRVEFIHPDAFHGMTSLRLLHLEGNHLQKLHPATFSTFSVFQHFPVSTLKHLYVSENLLKTLPREMLENMPQLENIFMSGNPWSCDCTMSWLQNWRTSVVKCKKDRSFADSRLCPRCSSPKHLKGKQMSDVKEFICSGPTITSSENHITHEENNSELLPIDRIKAPFGNLSLVLSDEHGNKAHLFCHILEPRDSTKISWNYTRSWQIAANLTLFFDVECSVNRENYESLWRLLAYYSEVAVHLRREIMLTKHPEVSYRYRQDIEKDAFYYTGVRAEVLTRPAWLMQSFINVKLNRHYSSSKSVRLILNTYVSTVADQEMIRQQKRSWVMIQQNNKTQTIFSSLVGGMIEMKCVVHSSEDAAVILWMLPDGSRIRAASSTHHNRVTVSNTGTLHIKSVEHANAGVYYCIAEVTGDMDILPFRLAVVDSSTPLQGEDIGSALTRFVGESSTLSCLSVAAPDAVVDWIFPDGSILNSESNSSRASIYSNGTLLIPYSQLNNNGYHKCVIMNQHGADVMATKLTVLRRKGAQPLRAYPSRPQSAAGVSTKVKAFVEDVEEASGDDVNTHERIIPNRIFINRRKGQGSFGHGRRRRPFTKNMRGEINKTAHAKNNMDPQKWADILAKIREKNTRKNPSVYKTPVKSVQRGNEEHPAQTDNTEGSSPDDSAQHAHNTQTATEEENKNITHTSEVNTITDPQSVSNDVITKERHVGTIRDEKTENKQIYSGPVIQPQSEPDNKLSLSKTIIRTSLSNPSNSSIVEKARNQLSSRRRYGSRRRMPFRRPFSKLLTNEPQSTTAGVHKSSTVTMNTDQITQDRDTSVYPTTGDTDHIYPTIIPPESVYPTLKTTAHNNPTIPPEDTSVYLSSRDTDHIYSTGDTSIHSNTYIYPTISTGSVNPTSGETANSYATIPPEGTTIHPTPRSTAHVYPTISTGSVNPTPGATVHNNPTIPPQNTSIHPTLKTSPTIPAGDTFVYPTSEKTDHDDTIIPPESVYVTPKTTARNNPTIPLEDTSVRPAFGETVNEYPTNPSRDKSTYPSPKTTSHIYPTIPPESVYLTPKTTSHNNPTIPPEDTSVRPAFGETDHIYPTDPSEDKSVHPTPKTTAHIYPPIPPESVYPSTGETDHKHPTIPTGDAFVYPTSGKSAHTHPKTTAYSYPTIPTVHQTTEATVNTPENKHMTVLQEKEDEDIAGENVEYITSINVDPTSTPVAGHLISPTSALQTDNSETDTAEDSFSPESHSDLRPENDALKRGSVASKEESVQFTSVPPPADRFQEESIQNQVPLPLTTETPTKPVISAGRPHSENNEIIFFRSVSTAEKPLIVPAATITSITTKPITTTTTSTKTPAVHTTPDQTLHQNRIPFYTRNPGTNHIDARKHGRVPITKNRDHYTESRNASGDPSSVHIKNTQTTSTAGSDHSTTSSNIAQSYQTAGVNRKWSETTPVVQMRPRITPGKLHTVTVNAGSRVQISCDADGEPKPHLSWTKISTGAVMSANTRIQRFEVQSNGTLIIQNVQLQDRGQYVCLAGNVYGSDKMTVTLVVSAQVPRVTLPRHRDLRVCLGNSALMECQAQGLPSPNISWVLPDRSVVRTVSESDGMGKKIVLFANGTLAIKRTSYLDRGVYKCIASNAAGADMLTVRLQIAALPPMIHQQRRENQTVPDGQDVFSHCTSEGSPSPSVRWVTFSGTQIRPSQFINGNLFVFPNGTLYIRKATEKDSGNYECVAMNSVGVASRSVNVQVKRNSSLVKIISSSSQNTDVQYGGQLSLHCTATRQPHPRIIWRTPSKKLLHAHYSSDGRMKVFSNGSLIISPVTEKDAGDYLCLARNKMGDDYLLVTVNVLMKAAKIQHKLLNNHKVSYGGELKVDCIASGLPDPEIAWSLPDGTMINSVLPSDHSAVRNKRYVVFDNGTLYFNQVGMREEGDYTCYAQNHMGKDEMKVHIQVLADAPVIQNNTYHVLRVHHGETAVVHCSAKGIPAPTITWTSPTHRVISPVSNKHQITSDGTLHIHKIQKLDTGNYTCLARNIVGTDRKVVHVEVLADVPVINGFKESSGIIRRTAVTDRRVLLDCRTEGKPVPQITWVLPNNITLPVPYYSWRITIHHNGTLDIRSLRMTDSGVFLCMARNEGGEAKLQIHLHVTDNIEKPRLRDLPMEHMPLTDGASVTLSCSVDGRPAPDITWTLPNGTSLLRGTAASRFHHKLDGSLFIREASVSDAGRYRCVGRNSAGHVQRTVTLESGRRPDIFNKYSSLVSIINGENLQLNCQSNGDPEPKLTWTRPDGVILTRPQQTGRYSVLKNGTLSVQRASVYDRGIYVCQTANQHGSSSLTVSVIVIAYPPRITSGPPAVTYARSGVALQLQCLALATPKAEVIWETPDGIQLKVGVQTRLYGNKYLHPQGSLTIQSPSKKDNGLYKCSAKNVVGSDSRSTYVYVF
ncbi:immunoglobulin superfamily member 10 [Triplophysa rosa]|uniref:Matrix-remodeling-associated protein 5-like n=1 Tax=Triplophysa rosa TaxID=992332 RepID=A0A9W7WUH9_TRIRA|nr:immunoglobulin superfamily member 10 [Triplophysa rosa]KAI7808657.1 putative matrix-remodeling-associated protein 5-like [Triplophysa rosa]